jgi:hypothetical protein
MSGADLIESLASAEGVWYLGTPYSKYPQGIHAAFQEACKAAAWLVERGVRVYCPIAHTHPIALMGGIDPLSHDIWLPVDQPFMELACGLIVCKMESWEESCGLRCEQQEFMRQGKPILSMEWPQHG